MTARSFYVRGHQLLVVGRSQAKAPGTLVGTDTKGSRSIRGSEVLGASSAYFRKAPAVSRDV